jgi:2-polyprenyl-3-methyl-5-hydroxy-6-metoxy-1,4-benzoquinol methylase
MGNSTLCCPLCSSKEYRTIFASSKHLHKCRGCGIIFNSGFQSLIYDDNYFINDYKERYGKTYLEDYDNIYRISQVRLHTILSLFKKGKPGSMRLLDIGSAMGFFLKAARDIGIGRTLGIEISSYAAHYCSQKFNIETVNSAFDEVHISEVFDIVTAWYFIEHCRDPGDVIKRIFNMLPKGGVFAFSTPSFFGPMYFLRPHEWKNCRPVDHSIDFSPFIVKRYLKSVGFRKVFVRPGGIHPDRVLSPNSLFYTPLSKIFIVLSRLISFSDTLEVYTIK